MRRTVFWSRDALDDLEGIIAYIARDSPAAARRVRQKIDSTARALGKMQTGRRGRNAGVYERVVVGLPYIIAYSLGESPAGRLELHILRVIHGARDWPEGDWPA